MPAPTTPAPTVEHVRSEVTAMLDVWETMQDSMLGQKAIKEKGTRYLSKPNADDVSESNSARYESYKQKALYYPVTQRTAAGFLGEIFTKAPQIELPKEMTAMHTNMDGSGSTAIQFSKNLTKHLLTKGRAGLLADFPKTSGAVTVADLEAKKIQPTIKLYNADSIINWRVDVVGAVAVLGMVVLSEDHQEPNGKFGYTSIRKYRVLELVEGQATVEVWSKPEGATAFAGEGVTVLKGADGKSLNELPFYFVGAEDNGPTPNQPPLLGLAYINIGHYCNSADVEDSAYFCGQPTLIVTGLTQEWLKGPLKGKIMIGSRTGIPLPPGCTAEMLQAEANNLPKELMADKERQMVAIGARLVEQKEVQRTATEAGQEEAGKACVISTIVHNENAAMKSALAMCAKFTVNRELKEGEDPELVFELNTDFNLAKMDAAARAQLIAEWQAGAIDFEEMRSGLKAAGVAFKDDQDVKDLVEEEMARLPTAPGAQPPAKKEPPQA